MVSATQPSLTARVERWLKLAKTIAWKFSQKGHAIMNFDDMCQEAYLAIVECFQYYFDRELTLTEEAKLVRTSVCNHLRNVYNAAKRLHRFANEHQVPIEKAYNLGAFDARYQALYVEEAMNELSRLLSPLALDVLLAVVYGSTDTGEAKDATFDFDINELATLLNERVDRIKMAILEIRYHVASCSYFADRFAHAC